MESDEVTGLAKSLVTAFLLKDRTVIDDLLGDTGDPEVVSALAALAASTVTELANARQRVPLVLWAETMAAHASLN